MKVEVVSYGDTSVTLRCEVRNLLTERSILKIKKMVFVTLDEDGRPTPHGKV